MSWPKYSRNPVHEISSPAAARFRTGGSLLLILLRALQTFSAIILSPASAKIKNPRLFSIVNHYHLFLVDNCD